jgi:predicted alpha/beta superfamily hydrolase
VPKVQKDKKYPVLYVLDGQWDFKLLDSVYGGLLYDKFVPEMYIVGITYAGADPNYDVLRAMDYTPVAETGRAGTGDGPKFLSFLRTELLPYIEQNYAADPHARILMGSSLGGLFTLYAMFTDPMLFSAYVSASPAVPYGERCAFKQEAAFASSHHQLNTRLFLSVGEIEPLAAPVKEFAKIITDRNYQGLKLETRVIAGERHSGVKPEAFNRGLRFVFEN